MWRIEPSVSVTREEYNFLQAERRRAYRDLQAAGLIEPAPDENSLPPQRVKLRILERAKDGAVRAAVLMYCPKTTQKYRRNLRAPCNLHSISDRGIRLRVARA